MAEREGFEPPELSLNGFQDRRLKPLGHLSGLQQSIESIEVEECDEIGFFLVRLSTR
jgi:hypothetical protein